ncbi:GNAT family N-acetyltransferase [Bacteroides sp. 224]|uniref:GNAT family N-acetyltransferase n=1 Tax=Bacteroides sp. 224 TaxID=2302936 RepID=UPI0013D27EE2|nr:GNAT family N-acetyltransferase [Bacteroides sp. 224]NDV66378.1 GNAT family N-acetyltransferase [Bacteroides sp. 224]
MNIKEQVKELWRTCFNDSEEFMDLYFTHRFNDDVNVVIEKEGKITSALQMIPYPMTLWGDIVQTSYISGACTCPDSRGKGAMKELLSLSFHRMVQTGVSLSTLIPAEAWLFEYYARMGYASIFRYSLRNLDASKMVLSLGEYQLSISETYNKQVFDYFNQKMQERSCCIQHTEADYKVILADLILSGGTTVTAYQQGKVVGVAFVLPEEGETLFVKELLADSAEIENHLLYEGCQTYKCKKISIITPAAEEDAPQLLLGMARIILAKDILQRYAAAYPDLEMNIELVDNQLPENSGYYRIASGKCVFDKEKAPAIYHQMTIGELTKTVFDKLNAYMSLMLD